MVKDAHGEDAVEAGKICRHIFDADWNEPDAANRTGTVHLPGTASPKTRKGSIPRTKSAPAPRNAPAVIAVAAADIEDPASGQRLDVRQKALPLPVGSPLGIDFQCRKNCKGLFARGEMPGAGQSALHGLMVPRSAAGTDGYIVLAA